MMEINRENINEIVFKSGLKPDKDYGQNYLVEPSICEKIISLLDIKQEDRVLEIGPGLGSLTHFLSLSNAKKIDLVDIDQRMIDFLKIIYNQNNIQAVLSDIRKHDVSSYDKIVGNLPYNITTETILYLLKNACSVKTLVLMCQTEAFARFSNLDGKEYGPASILVHLLGKVERKLTVKPGSFYPAPKCSSTVFKIQINENADYSYCWNVYLLAKNLFLNRRKTIYNNLTNYLNDKDKAESLLNNLKIDARKRPEELSPQTYVDMYERIKVIS